MNEERFRRAVNAGEFVAGEFAVRQKFCDVAKSNFRRRPHGELEAIDESVIFPLAGFDNRRWKRITEDVGLIGFFLGVPSHDDGSVKVSDRTLGMKMVE